MSKVMTQIETGLMSKYSSPKNRCTAWARSRELNEFLWHAGDRRTQEHFQSGQEGGS